MTPDKPRFRNDLVSQPIEEEGIQYVDVTDPESGKVFRFYDVEYSIACAMDGSRDLSRLSQWTKTELGIETSVEELSGVVTTLAELGYLEAAVASSPAKAAAHIDRAEGAKARGTALPGRDASVGEETSFEGLIESSMVPAPARAAPPPPAPRQTAPLATPLPRRAPPPMPSLMRAATGDGVPEPTADDAVLEMEVGYEGESVDLSDHTSLDMDDVKEAVRASQVLDVPDLPQGADDLVGAATPGAFAGLEDEPYIARPGDAVLLSEERPTMRPMDPDHLPQPSDLPRKSNWPIVAIALFLLLVGGGATVWFFFFAKPPQVAGTGPGPNVSAKTHDNKTAATKPDAQALAPKWPAARVAKSETVTVDVKAPIAGSIEWVAEDKASLEIGEPVAKYVGYKKFEGRRSAAEQRLDYYKEKLDRAKGSGVASVEKKVKEKRGLVEQAQAEMDKLVIKAPIAGVASPLVGVGAKIKAGDVVARLGGGKPQLMATFDVGDKAASYLPDKPCQLAAKDKREQKYACVVAKVQGSTVVVRVTAPTAAEDMEVLLVPAAAPKKR